MQTPLLKGRAAIQELQIICTKQRRVPNGFVSVGFRGCGRSHHSANFEITGEAVRLWREHLLDHLITIYVTLNHLPRWR